MENPDHGGPGVPITLRTKMSISCALSQITATPVCCPSVVKYLGLPALIALLEESDIVIKKDAVTALGFLVVHPETKAPTIDSGVIKALVNLSESSDLTLNQGPCPVHGA